MDDPSLDPVDMEGQFDAGFQSRCTISSSNSSGDQIVKMKVPDAKPAGTVSLISLSVEDVCCLLEHFQLNAVTSVARENQFSGCSFLISSFPIAGVIIQTLCSCVGNILATGVESADDLKEFGIKSMFAQSLFKHVLQWKTEGVPANIFTQNDPVLSQVPVSMIGATSIGAGAKFKQDNRSLQQQHSNTTFVSSTLTLPLSKQSVVSSLSAQTQPRLSKQAQMELDIRDLTNLLTALHYHRHHDSARLVLGMDNRGNGIKCCICEPDIVRDSDTKPLYGLPLECRHNNNLVLQLERLAATVGSMNIRGSGFHERFNLSLDMGYKRLQALEKQKLKLFG